MQIEDFIVKFSSSQDFKNIIVDKSNILSDNLKLNPKRTFKEYEFKSELMKIIYKKSINRTIKQTKNKPMIRKIS
jgi:hypothetical protein